MRIIAVSVGTRGDVQPLIELGVEMIRRGHDFSVMTSRNFIRFATVNRFPIFIWTEKLIA